MARERRMATNSPRQGIKRCGGAGNDTDPQRAMYLLRRERTGDGPRRWSCTKLLLVARGYAGSEAATLDIIAEVQQRPLHKLHPTVFLGIPRT